MILPIYKLMLHKTYYDKGFFNLGVDVDRFVRKGNGSIDILLGTSKEKIEGKVNRNANLNGTPRIFGGIKLRDWIWRNFQFKDIVDVIIIEPNIIWLKK
ncbi:MAG: hypothetical protein COB54_04280 [Alphaproteobacteria bacterium]|nr:MAG: hypothetical protein COB54_04280 [Alphaproteobacteria bacterium]